MECLKQVSPEHWQDVPMLKQFFDDLPTNPYCTNSKGFTYIRNKEHAIKHRYIQPNHPAVVKWLVFDIDDTQALFTCFDEFLPLPQVIIKNPDNGHAHYCYKLSTPVGMGGSSSIKAMGYLASVQNALCEALGADKGYSGNLIKNPCYVKPDTDEDEEHEENGERDEHETYIIYGVQSSYTLAELADYLDLEPLYSQTPQEPANDSGYGRNCTLFDELRHIAYRLEDKSYNSIIRELQSRVDNINNGFDVPLPYQEVRHIIRSIARYCSRMNFTESHIRFSERQRARVQRRWGDNTDKKEQAKILKSEGLSVRKIAERLNVGKSTVARWLK